MPDLERENARLRSEVKNQARLNAALTDELRRLTGLDGAYPTRMRTAGAYLVLGARSPNALWRDVEHGVYRPGIEVFDTNRKRFARAEGMPYKPVYEFDVLRCLERQQEVG